MAVFEQNKKAKKEAHPVKQQVKKVAPSTKPGQVADLRHRLNMKQADFARLLPVSVRSLATLERGTPPSEAVSRRLNELQRLAKALSEVVKKESIGEWLQTPNKAFDGLKPMEVIDRGESDRIWSMVFFLRSGVSS